MHHFSVPLGCKEGGDSRWQEIQLPLYLPLPLPPEAEVISPPDTPERGVTVIRILDDGEETD
jgi:hypothetical protein